MTVIYGSVSNNNLVGTNSADAIHGGDGNDTINGGAGNDSLFGDLGNDRMRGGPGDDQLSGGGGADTFVFYRADGHDRISDYQQGIDHIELHGISSKEITWAATDGGMTVRYGGMGGLAVDHGEIFVPGVTGLGFSDFVLS
jgi:Ca2+-binding RTX toxin-like protein